jgi:hypothetical protein
VFSTSFAKGSCLRTNDTELNAVGVGQHNDSVSWLLTPRRPERDQPVHLCRRIAVHHDELEVL